jgi:hypothetical protein
MNARLAILLAALSLAASGCYISTDGVSWIWNVDAIEGSGILATETRSVPDFRLIEVQGSFDVTCRVGGEPQVKITGDDNLLIHVVAEVQGETLLLRMESGRYSFDSGLHVAVVAPALAGVSLSGSADVDVTGVSTTRFDASVSGSGNLQVDGEVGHLQACLSGSGELRLDHLRATTADVSLSGSGDADVNVTDQLDASLSGSGDIRYRGDPHATLSISGSGSIDRK